MDISQIPLTHVLKFTEYHAPTGQMVRHSKLGGLPTGFPQHLWPVSPKTLQKMTFVFQMSLALALPMAEYSLYGYFFMSPTADDENNCLVDGDEFQRTESKFLIHHRQAEASPSYGPVLNVEFGCNTTEVYDISTLQEPLCTSKLGGRPGWLQHDETPRDAAGNPMLFFGQVDSEDVGWASVEYYFFDATLYFFVTQDLRFGQAIWQNT